MSKLYCKGVVFYSEEDELNFSHWISKIHCIRSKEGIGNYIILNINKNVISDKCLRELLALFYRYKLDMAQLQQFCTDNNRSWFKSPGKYWYKKVFGMVE